MKAQTARWLAGCAASGSVALMAGGAALAFADRHVVPASPTGWASYIGQQLVNVVIPVTGLVLASRRPRNRIGWLFLTAGLALGLNVFSQQYAQYALDAHHGPVFAGRTLAWLANWTWLIPIAMLPFLLLLFPTGSLHSPRWRWAAWAAGVAFTLATGWELIDSTLTWAHPFTSASHGPAAVLDDLTAVLTTSALLISVAALVVRFARSAGEERLQLKWCAAAALLLVASFITLIWVNTALVNVLQSLAFMGLWTAIAVAVLKYRLYEIDRIISRTLAYAIVTGLLIGFYAGLVLLATRVLSFRTPLAVAAATLAAAALFNPLRRQVQIRVDRRFNRARYDADHTVTAFTVRLKDTVDLDSVRENLADAVHQALEPAHVSVWTSKPRR